MAAAKRYGIRRLPDVDGDKPKRPRFKTDPFGHLHIDLAQVGTGQGKRRYAFTCQIWTKEPEGFRVDPSQHSRDRTPG